MLHPLIVSQCGPKRRNTVRMNWIERLPKSEMFCSVGFECEDYSVSAAAYSIYLPDPSFRLPTWPVRLPP
jgi:hypothetical protein